LNIGFARFHLADTALEIGAGLERLAPKRCDDITRAQAGVIGRGARKDFPHDNAIIVSVIEHDAELFERLDFSGFEVFRKYGWLDKDFLVAAIAINNNFHPRFVRVEQVLNEVRFAVYTTSVDRDNAIAFVEPKLGNRTPAGNIGNHQAIAAAAVKPQSNVGSPHIGWPKCRPALSAHIRALVRPQSLVGTKSVIAPPILESGSALLTSLLNRSALLRRRVPVSLDLGVFARLGWGVLDVLSTSFPVSSPRVCCWLVCAALIRAGLLVFALVRTARRRCLGDCRECKGRCSEQ